uniref:Uncharacterized protein n=1 Tax=Junco hyemalis TaxID=40217 RepID=A0A8C5NP17_JUNHY
MARPAVHNPSSPLEMLLHHGFSFRHLLDTLLHAIVCGNFCFQWQLTKWALSTCYVFHLKDVSLCCQTRTLFKLLKTLIF